MCKLDNTGSFDLTELYFHGDVPNYVPDRSKKTKRDRYIESDEAVQEMYEFINNVILFDIPAEFKGKGQ